MRSSQFDINPPFFVSSGPLTRSIEFFKNAEDAGARAISTKLILLKKSKDVQLRCFSMPGQGVVEPTDRRLSIDEGIKLVSEVKRETKLLVAGNIGGNDDIDEWVVLSQALQNAGCDFIEANFCCPNFDEIRGISEKKRNEIFKGSLIGEVPSIAGKITTAIKSAISIPLICKISPSPSQLKSALTCESAGADAVHLFGGPLRGLPAVDIYNSGMPSYPLMEKATCGSFHGPCNIYSTFNYIAEGKLNLKIPIIGSGGIKDWKDAIMMMMWGASYVAVCTQIMWHGFEIVEKITRGMADYRKSIKLKSYKDIVGCSLKFLSEEGRAEIKPGVARISTEACNRCGKCLKIGHCNAIETNDYGMLFVNKTKCLGCGICISLCTQKAITMEVF